MVNINFYTIYVIKDTTIRVHVLATWESDRFRSQGGWKSWLKCGNFQSKAGSLANIFTNYAASAKTSL